MHGTMAREGGCCLIPRFLQRLLHVYAIHPRGAIRYRPLPHR